ncbi:ABC transporter, partial [Halorubrum saccharovorum]
RVVLLHRGEVAAAGPLDRLLDEHDAPTRGAVRVAGGETSALARDEGDGSDGSGSDDDGDETEPAVHVTGVSDR